MPIRIGIGFSIEKDPNLAAREAARIARANIASEAIDLAIVFSSISLSCGSLIQTISNYLPNVPILGASSAVIITNQGIFKHGLVIMLLDLPKEAYINTACVKDINAITSFSAGEKLGEKLLHNFGEIRRLLSIIFSDGLIPEASKLIAGLQAKLGKSFPLAGASASDNLRFLKTYIYFNRDIFSDAACGLLLGGKLNFGLGIKHGWKPLGKPRYVTNSTGNVVREIDGMPAAKIYQDYLACDLNELKKKLKYISILYPIGVYLAEEEEYLLRNLLSIQNDGSLIFQGDLPQKAQLRLMIGTKESCLKATREAAQEAKKNLSLSSIGMGKKEKNNFVLAFDSISRYILLRKEADKELGIIKKEFGENTPVIGIYTYGEQAPLKAVTYQGKAYFHNQTITVLAIEG